jgi:hypothetical protein
VQGRGAHPQRRLALVLSFPLTPRRARRSAQRTKRTRSTRSASHASKPT